jgi:hypothetical protein
MRLGAARLQGEIRVSSTIGTDLRVVLDSICKGFAIRFSLQSPIGVYCGVYSSDELNQTFAKQRFSVLSHNCARVWTER